MLRLLPVGARFPDCVFFKLIRKIYECHSNMTQPSCDRQVNNCDIILNDVSSRVTPAVTGLPIFAFRESLYTEKGWQT